MQEREIKSFEDLYVYRLARDFSKLARDFSKKVSKLIRNLPSSEEYNLKSQMRLAKLSMTNNIAEGYGRFHYQENIQFCRQSRASVYELIDDFNACFDEGYIDEKTRDDYKNDAYSLIRVLNNYIASIKNKKISQQVINSFSH